MSDSEDKPVQNKRLHLTYKTHLTDEQLTSIKERVDKWDITQYSMCHENGHGDTPYEHTHILLVTRKPMKTENMRFFDIDGIHPNWKAVCTVTHMRHILSYHQKEGKLCVQEPPVNWGTPESQRIEFDEKDLFELAQANGLAPKSIGDLKALQECKRKRPAAEITYTLDDFITKMEHIECNFVHGLPGTGKTQWAKAHFESPLLVGTIDTLKQFNPARHDGIVFDDMSFTHWPREGVIQLLDWDEDRDVHCRFNDAFIPKHTRKIFTSNKPFEEVFGPYMKDEAIMRRISAIYTITKDLRKDVEQTGARAPRFFTL